MLKTVNTTWIKMTEQNFPEIIPSRKYEFEQKHKNSVTKDM